MKLMLLVIVVVLVALGFYLNWFHLSSQSAPNKAAVTLSVDENKMEADKTKAVDKVESLEHRTTAKLDAATQKAPD